VHLVGFTVEIYHDARSHERQIWSYKSGALKMAKDFPSVQEPCMSHM